MILILTEQPMNGSKSMAVYTTGVEADSFKEAVARVKNAGAEKNLKPVIHSDNDAEFSFTIPSDMFPIFGVMRNSALKML
jgi:hypothetical protein